MSRLYRIFPVFFFCIVDYLLAHIDEVWANSVIYNQNIVFYVCTGLRFALFMLTVSLLSFEVIKIEKTSRIFWIGYFIFALIEYGKFCYGQYTFVK